MIAAVVVDRTSRGGVAATYTEWPEPQAGPADLVIEPLYVGICGSDLEQLHGRVPHSFQINYPHTMGHEWSGTVIAHGEEVTGYAMGDVVLGHGHLGGNNWFGFTHDGAMAERFAVPAAMCFPVPQSVDPLTAAILEPFACVRAGLAKIGHVQAGQVVHVYGLGTIGLCAVMQAVAAGARVIAMDPSDFRRDLAQKVGAAQTLDPTAENFDAGDVVAADVVVEATGVPAALASTLETSGHGARVLFLGVSRPVAHPARLGLIQERDLLLVSSTGAPPWVWPETIEMVASQSLDLSVLVTSILPMDRIDEALARAENASTDVKVVLATSSSAAVSTS